MRCETCSIRTYEVDRSWRSVPVKRHPPLLLFLSPGLILLALSARLETIRPRAGALGTGAPSPTPTIDRLAQPTLPAAPGQADLGAQVYWSYCLPCHGDRGQGLTAEFRQTYPPEEQYCWQRGCHGERPYENGFTLPAAVPALIGSTALGRFETAASLQGYIKAAMPFWKPGLLTEQQSWEVTAYLVRANDLGDGRMQLDAGNAGSIRLRGWGAIPSAVPSPTSPPPPEQDHSWIALGAGMLVAGGVIAVWLSRRSRTS